MRPPSPALRSSCTSRSAIQAPMEEPTSTCGPSVRRRKAARLSPSHFEMVPSAKAPPDSPWPGIVVAQEGAAGAFGPGGERLGLGAQHVRAVAAEPDDARRAALDATVGDRSAIDVQKFRLGHASSQVERGLTRLLAQAGRARKVPPRHGHRTDAGSAKRRQVIYSSRRAIDLFWPRHDIGGAAETPDANDSRRRLPFADHSRLPRRPRKAPAQTPTSGSPAFSSSAQTAEISAKFPSTTHCCSPKRPGWTSWKFPRMQIRPSPRFSISAS